MAYISNLIITVLAVCGLYHKTGAKTLNTTDCDLNGVVHVVDVVIDSVYPVDISKPINISADIFLSANRPKLNGSKLVLELLSKRQRMFGEVCEKGKGRNLAKPFGELFCVLSVCEFLGQKHCDAIDTQPNATHYQFLESITLVSNPIMGFIAEGSYDIIGKVVTADRKTQLGCLDIRGLTLKKSK